MTWLPGYERVPVLGCTGPGTYVDGYPWRIVLHTTESPFGSGAGIVAFFQANPCSCPHFMLDPGTGRRVQFIPTEYSAAALRGGRNGYETNRGHAIQVEICGRADEAAGWSDSVLDFIGSWIADVVRSGIPIGLDNVTGNDYRGTVATESSPYRMAPGDWRAFDGVCGHIDVPYQDHYDPYRLDKRRCVEHAKAHLGQQPTPTPTQEWDDMASKDEVKAAVLEALGLSSSADFASFLKDRDKVAPPRAVIVNGDPSQWIIFPTEHGLRRFHIASTEQRALLIAAHILSELPPASVDAGQLGQIPIAG